MNRTTKLFVLLIILTLALAACGGGEEETAADPTAVSDADDAPTATAEPATAVPTEAPTTTPTPAPTATIAPSPTATAEPAPQRLGLLRFRDSEAARAGQFQLLMEGVSPAPEGSHYELWLIDDSFNTRNLGAFSVDGEVTFSGDTEQNLLSAFNGALVSIEPDDVDDGEIGTIAFEGEIPAGSLTHVRHVVTAFPQNPNENAFLIGATQEISQALNHAGFLQEELANDNVAEAQRHAEHVINILVGEESDNFGDLDGDGVPQNPGDGFGVRAYLNGAKEHTQLAAAAENATAEVNLHAEHVQISSDNALARLDAAVEEALRVISSDTADEAQPAADELIRLLEAALNGQDADGDGAIAPVEDEGGIQTAYVHALNMGAFEFFAAEGAAATGDAPAATETPAAADSDSETEEEAGNDAPPPVTIEMTDFAYQPGDITVPVGATVTWVNQDDGVQHSATAADGAFDTGLFESGGQASFTFTEPGTYLYYCTLHGAADGSGMAATITVEE